MAGDINAIGILVVPIATAFLVVKFGRLRKRLLVILLAIILPICVAEAAQMAISPKKRAQIARKPR